MRLLSSLAVLFLFWIFFSNGIASSGPSPVKVDWRDLRALNIKTGRKPKSLSDLNGKVIQIAGFMVPLEDSLTKVSEFLLVPSPQACIHVPPPPPNQIIYVKMNKDAKIKVAYIPISVKGKLRIMNTDSPYGKVSYWMTGDTVSDFHPEE